MEIPKPRVDKSDFTTTTGKDGVTRIEHPKTGYSHQIFPDGTDITKFGASGSTQIIRPDGSVQVGNDQGTYIQTNRGEGWSKVSGNGPDWIPDER